MRETIEATILGLARELSLLLARQGEGARRLDVSLFGVDGRVRHLRAGTSRPLRDPVVIARLFREKIEAAGNADERDPLEDILNDLACDAEDALDKLTRPERCDDEAVRAAVCRAVKKASQRIWDRRPIVEATVVRN